MRKSLILTLALTSLAVCACNKPDQEKAGEHAKAAAAKIGDATKEVATSPEMKAVGADLKDAAADAAAATKDAAADAGVAAKNIAADVKADAGAAKAKIEARTDETKK